MVVIVRRTLRRRVDHMTLGSHTVLVNFCAGGLIYWLIWQVRNNFPEQVRMMTPYLTHMIDALTIWDMAQGADRRKFLMDAHRFEDTFE